MPNKHHMPGNPWGKNRGGKPRPAGNPPSAPEKTAAWPGLPGKKQSRTRDVKGTPKVQEHMKKDY